LEGLVLCLTLRPKMLSNWIATEYHRLHLVEKWPDSPRKEANLAAIRSTLASLSRETLSSGLPKALIVRTTMRARSASV
jgi:hypothetical protein